MQLCLLGATPCIHSMLLPLWATTPNPPGFRLTFTQANNKRSFSRPDVNMTQVNVCLKRTFTFFNILFAILGALVIGLALVSQSVSKNHGAGEVEGRTTGLLMLYIVGSVTMMIAILGAYGAQKENKGALIAFLVFMVIGTLIMWKTGTSMAISSPQIENVMEQKFRSLLPLDQSPESTQNMMSSVQTTLQCCGLFSYEDWENNIPSSCACNSEQEFEGNCRTVNYNELLQYHQEDNFQGDLFPPIIMAVCGHGVQHLHGRGFLPGNPRPTWDGAVPP
uniref:Tetraspanin n=1 Tax=Gadus morhua TaxID=8049 RepID=A0A8C5AZZ8_GADMO